LSAPSISSTFLISATLRSSFSKSSKLIVVTPSIISLGSSDLLRFGLLFGVSIFSKRTGAFLILLDLKIFDIFSADSGMNGESIFAISRIASTS